MGKYAITIRIDMDCFDDIEARTKARIKLLALGLGPTDESKVKTCEIKLQEIKADSPPRKIEL